MAAEDYAENKNEQSSQIKGTRTNNGTSNNECDDLYKIHVSRIPTKFTEEAVQRILENKIGPGTVEDVVFIYKRPEDDADTDDANASSKESSKPKQNNRKEKKKERSDNDDNRINEAKTPETEHRGFGFVVLKDEPSYNKAVQLESVRGGRKATSSKQHTLYIRPYVQQTQESDRTKCYLWAKFRCPYGNDCKFDHDGPGGCLIKGEASKKKQKCFAFKKGKCNKGDDCPFSHDFVPQVTVNEDTKEDAKEECVSDQKRKKAESEKDCINWKTKGKCRKGDNCPYKHDDALRQAALLKKKRKQQCNAADGEKDSKCPKRNKQPLWVRIFGLNYETT